MKLPIIAVLVLAAGGSAAPAATPKPNVVFILADDLGYGDLACYGHPYARTPNLDRLANEGTRFTQFCTTGVTCCPSRTGFMTGKFPATYREYPAGFGFGERTTVTALLHDAGYRTGHFGKWHIGPTQKPGTYGIDVIGEDRELGVGRTSDSRGRDAPIFDAAIRFIEQNQDRPFYLNVWGHITHFPVNPPLEYAEKFKDVRVKEADFSDYMTEKFAAVRKAGGNLDACMQRYLGDLYALDEDVGRLLKRLDELGLRDNTIVVFSSDQGPAPVASAGIDRRNARALKKQNPDRSPEIRLNMLGSAGGLRGGKHTMYEGGVRVPMIVRWPARVPAGRVDATSLTSGIDWLPTICALTGVPTGAIDQDGEDVSAAWLGKSFTRGKPLLWKTSNVRSNLAVRDGQWKLHQPHATGGELELYDLSSDAGERKNLAAQRPEIVERLRTTIEKWNATLPKKYVKTADKDD
jgi:N-acetylgalactosamine-6-sulfatase